MVQVVLESGVDDPVAVAAARIQVRSGRSLQHNIDTCKHDRVHLRVIRRQPRELISPVKVDSVGVEEECPLEEHDVHVDRNEQGEDKQRGGAHELIDELVGDDGKRPAHTESDMFIVWHESPTVGVTTR